MVGPQSDAELLIDVTSHELRQPVSAILNCSSLVRSNLARHRDELARALMNKESFRPTKELLGAIDDDLEALDAIYQACMLAFNTYDDTDVYHLVWTCSRCDHYFYMLRLLPTNRNRTNRK